ncbi:MAG: hypothetical protein MZV63_15905 [Marinilabiliales bacterium]|nr:hypothetical protein [Marinilabiliales bacterium]
MVACPVTSGDTAFRSARLTIADMLNIPQKKILAENTHRWPSSVFAVAFLLTFPYAG